MANRPGLLQTFDRLIDVAGKIREISPAIVDELRTLVRHPRSLGSWIEAKSPWLGKRFLGAASTLAEPFTVGMGLKVETLGEDTIEVVMPGGWRNQGEGGGIHTGALSALGEFAMRIYWEHHLDLKTSGVESRRVEVRILSRPEGEMKAVFRLPVADREAILHRLRAETRASLDAQTLIYDRAGRLVAEVDVDWELTRQLALGAGTGSSSS